MAIARLADAIPTQTDGREGQYVRTYDVSHSYIILLLAISSIVKPS